MATIYKTFLQPQNPPSSPFAPFAPCFIHVQVSELELWLDEQKTVL